MSQYNVSFAGAGRVGTHLCKEIYQAGHKIDLIVSMSEKSGDLLAHSCNSKWSQSLIFQDSTDIIIVAVPDHNLKNVLDRIKCGTETLVVHTAGSFGIDIFPDNIKHKGVLYPLQTFSMERKVVFKNIPFFLESSDIQSDTLLKNLTESLGSRAQFSGSEQRRIIHLAGVFVCNFTNHMLTAGKEVAKKTGLPFDVLKPLIEETFSKAIDKGPENSQTGPAIRNDQNTIEKHLELLSFSPELKRLYLELTLAITEFYQKKL
jgi:predicted short-subunit dehydrogenase-like oxidoreductase (DUF2520 family)